MNKIIDVSLNDEMKRCYVDYAMSVIVARALPDVRDGLKPVQRRILYTMGQLNILPDKPHRKSARIVGTTLGTLHPHGDSSVYEAMVKMAQPFSYREMLVDGHGNFGSIDGDGAAAMRYTEARLSKISMEMLADVNKKTVDFTSNFDESTVEPCVLPARFPNLLVNGSSGIAVGMATNIPPHNLEEVIDAVVEIIDNKIKKNKETTIDEIMSLIKIPDFPTGGVIINDDEIEKAYRTGKGIIKMRGVLNIEPMKSGKQRIVITELPYQVNKARLIEKIASLVKEKKIEGITALRDESGRQGMRIAIELKKGVDIDITLNKLYKHTQLQDSFGVNMLALVHNEPKLLNIKQMLDYYLDHQRDVVTRRTQYNLEKAQNRGHILQGLLIALNNIDKIIKTIKGSKNSQEAKISLIDTFKLTEIQAQAIVEMKLRALTGLEKGKLEKEFDDITKLIGELQIILNDEKELLKVIRKEIKEIKNKYKSPRRTRLIDDVTEIKEKDMVENQDMVLTFSSKGYIKMLTPNDYEKSDKITKNDFIKQVVQTNTHSELLFISNLGQVYKIKCLDIPIVKKESGTAIVNLIDLSPKEKIVKIISVEKYNEDESMLMTTQKGMVKKTSLKEYEGKNKQLVGIKLKGDDTIVNVDIVKGDQDIIIATKLGQCIRFNQEGIRDVGRNSMGVKGITLAPNDRVISSNFINENDKALIVSENGFAKKVESSNFPFQNRGGKGVRYYKSTKKTGEIVNFEIVNDTQSTFIVTIGKNIHSHSLNEIKDGNRVTNGGKFIELKDELIQDISIV